MEVNLRAVECTVAFVDRVGKIQLLQCIYQTICCCFPVLITSHAVLRAGGELKSVLKAELGVHLVNQPDYRTDLLGDLILAHEDMGIILCETANPEEAVQNTFQFMTVHNSQLGKTHRQLAVAVRLICIHHHTAGAVHRFDTVVLIIDAGRIHVLFVVIPVTACLPETAVHDERR